MIPVKIIKNCRSRISSEISRFLTYLIEIDSKGESYRKKKGLVFVVIAVLLLCISPYIPLTPLPAMMIYIGFWTIICGGIANLVRKEHLDIPDECGEDVLQKKVKRRKRGIVYAVIGVVVTFLRIIVPNKWEGV